MSRTRFAGLVFDLADGWLDMTEDMPPDSPFTLAKNDGSSSVIQFSVAKYGGGTHPDIKLGDVEDLLADFCAKKGLEPLTVTSETHETIDVAGCTATSGPHLLAIWYVSNGQDVALITYCAYGTSGDSHAGDLRDAAGLVSSIEFPGE